MVDAYLQRLAAALLRNFDISKWPDWLDRRLNDDEKKRKKWSQFETQVASLYRQLGYQVTENASVAGQQIDLLAEKIEPGVGKIRLLIECKHRTRQAPVSNQEVYDFISMVKAVAERAQITKGVMITNGSFSDMAFAASEGSGLIELLRSDALDDFFFHLPSVYEVYVRV
ncbi:MAG: restriction endonuclease [Acidobacteria bacterium]|nr:restriction endonuclease [Acidobacteriota bacterium]